MTGRNAAVTSRMEGTAWILTFPPELVADVEDALEPVLEEVLASPGRLVVADLSRVTLSNTAGLGTLVGLVRRAREAGMAVVFAGASGRTRVLMDRLQMGEYARVTGTVADALRTDAP